MKPDVLEEFLQQPHVGVISTLRQDGMPYTVPIWWLWKDGKVWITGTYSRLWCQQLLKDPRASLCIEAGAPVSGHVGFDGYVQARERPDFDIWPISRELATKYVGRNDPANAEAVRSFREYANGAAAALRTDAPGDTRHRYARLPRETRRPRVPGAWGRRQRLERRSTCVFASRALSPIRNAGALLRWARSARILAHTSTR